MVEILTKIHAKITIIVVENREPYYFIIICKCKKALLSLFSYQTLASTFDYDGRSIYTLKVYGPNQKFAHQMICSDFLEGEPELMKNIITCNET